jgi:predicted house-cleaning NTP pyrophosphatase (Maf/HAM1 superfamily)
MKYGYEPVYEQAGFVVPQNAVVNTYPTPSMTIGTLISTEAMNAILIRSDSVIFTEDEIVDKACKMAEAMLRRLL